MPKTKPVKPKPTKPVIKVTPVIEPELTAKPIVEPTTTEEETDVEKYESKKSHYFNIFKSKGILRDAQDPQKEYDRAKPLLSDRDQQEIIKLLPWLQEYVGLR